MLQNGLGDVQEFAVGIESSLETGADAIWIADFEDELGVGRNRGEVRTLEFDLAGIPGGEFLYNLHQQGAEAGVEYLTAASLVVYFGEGRNRHQP